MKALRITAMQLGLALITLAIAGTGFGQMQPGSGPGSRMRGPLYDTSKETTVKGTVQEVQQTTGRRGGEGTHLILKTADGTLDVHLGPASFVKEKGFTFENGDTIEVTGSKTTFQKGEALIAREVKKDGKTLTLRDAKGYPAWSRRGPRSASR